MRSDAPDASRRGFLLGLGGLAVGRSLGATMTSAATDTLRLRPIPATGELLPAVGLGTWLTFNTAPYTDSRAACVDVLRAFFAHGGTLVDSSPMYGLAEATVGDALEKIGGAPPLFSATKVWVPTRPAGVVQMKASAGLWGLERFDLMQVHNMLDWEAHLRTLTAWKAEGRIRYIGITTSHGRRHDAMLEVIERRPAFDFVQFSYSIGDREAEHRLLPAAAARGKAVIVNRPFRTGELFERVEGKSLPPWAAEIGCTTWAQYFLKFAISHPAVTCAIPATSRVDHLVENKRALRGVFPDAALRARMARHFDSI